MTRYVAFLFAFVLFAYPCFAGSVEDSIKDLGFQPLKSSPINFDLPSVANDTIRLRQYKGKWIFLVFWATWCGPCNYEMPQLESLYQELRDKGLVVVGVSVDQGGVEPVREFVKSKNITFPMAVDQSSSVSSRYSASSIPTVYAISPSWKIVGVLFGAISWEDPAILAKAKRLVTMPHQESSTASPEETPEPEVKESIELPNDLAPPEMALVLAERAFNLNDKFPLEVQIKWKGDFQKYLIKVPQITLPEGIKQGDISSSTSSINGAAILSYQIALQSTAAGNYRIGPVELAYQPRQGGQEQFSRLTGIDITITALPIWKRPLVIVLAILTLALVIASVSWLVIRRGKSRAIAEPSTKNYSGQYEELRKSKPHVTTRQYSLALIRLVAEQKRELREGDVRVNALAEIMAYGDMSLSNEEIRHYEKYMEKAISS